MGKVRWPIHLVVLLSCILVNGNLFSPFTNEIEQCKDICSDSFFILPFGKDAQSICQRGCRFFNIIDLKDEHDSNITKEECYLSCEESYINLKERRSCTTGCDAMFKKKENELVNIFVFVEHDSGKNASGEEQEFDFLELDILSDPIIRHQLQVDRMLEYKIPETRIQTMPIEKFGNDLISQDFNFKLDKKIGDWLDCAARNSGIPKWVLLTAILVAIFAAVWLSCSSSIKNVGDEILEKEQLENDGKSNCLCHELDEENFWFLWHPEVVPETKEKENLDEDFNESPKYTIESEKV